MIIADQRGSQRINQPNMYFRFSAPLIVSPDTCSLSLTRYAETSDDRETRLTATARTNQRDAASGTSPNRNARKRSSRAEVARVFWLRESLRRLAQIDECLPSWTIDYCLPPRETSRSHSSRRIIGSRDTGRRASSFTRPLATEHRQ